MNDHQPQNLHRTPGRQPAVVGLSIDGTAEIPFGLLLGSAWALVFTSTGSLLALMLLALLR